jgi:WD40 repeat protein
MRRVSSTLAGLIVLLVAQARPFYQGPPKLVGDEPSRTARPHKAVSLPARGTNLSSGKKAVSRVLADVGPYSSLALSADGKWLVTSDTQRVSLWEVVTGKEVRVFKGHTDSVGVVAFSTVGQRSRPRGEP